KQKSIGESWQSQHSGESDLAPRPATELGRWHGQPAADRSPAQYGCGGHCAAGTRRGQNGLGTVGDSPGNVDDSEEAQEELAPAEKFAHSQKDILLAAVVYGRHSDQSQGAARLSHSGNL